MSCYVVCFQVKESSVGQRVRELLKGYSTYCPIDDSTWAIVTEETAVQIRDKIGGALTHADRLFVVRSGVEAAWRNPISDQHSEWLKKHL